MSDIVALGLMRDDLIRVAGSEPAGQAIGKIVEATKSGRLPPVAIVTDDESDAWRFISLRGALEVASLDQPVSEIPEPDGEVPSVSLGASLEEIVSQTLASPVDAVAVVEDGRLLGAILLGDLFDHVMSVALVDRTGFSPDR